MEREFNEEILDALGISDGDKAPSPDGFNFSFQVCCWGSLREDFMKFFNEFHNKGILSKELKSSFVSLISKKEGASELGHFRPISLVGSVYKLLANVLADRLRAVLQNVIRRNAGTLKVDIS